MKSPVKAITDLAASLLGPRDTITALRQQHEALQAERARVLAGRAPRSDVLKALRPAIEALAAQQKERLGLAVVDSVGGTLDALPNGENSRRRFLFPFGRCARRARAAGRPRR
jgi:hypothetical protein